MLPPVNVVPLFAGVFFRRQEIEAQHRCHAVLYEEELGTVVRVAPSNAWRHEADAQVNTCPLTLAALPLTPVAIEALLLSRLHEVPIESPLPLMHAHLAAM